MTDAVVLDSSAILTHLNEEPGAAEVEAVLDRAIVGAVNLAEVASKIGGRGLGPMRADETLVILSVRAGIGTATGRDVSP